MNGVRAIAIFFGILFLVGTILEFSIAMHNNEVLQENKAFGYYNQSDEQLVQFQFTCATILLILTAVSFAIAFAVKDKEEKEVIVVHQPKTVPLPPSPPEKLNLLSPQSTDTREDITEKLRKLKQLYDEGIITEEEYEKKRRDLLDRF